MNDLITGLIFTIGSFVISILLYFVYFSQEKVNTAKSRIFKWLLIFNFLVIVSEIISSLLVYYLKDLSIISEKAVTVHWMFGLLYYVLQYYYAYALYKMPEEKDIKKVLFGSTFNKIFLVLSTIVCIGTFFVPIVDMNYEVVEYLPKYVSYVVFGYSGSVGILILVLFMYKNNKTFAEYFYTIFNIVASMFILLFQIEFPYVGIAPFVMLLGLLSIYFLIENPYIYVSKKLEEEQKIIANEGKTKSDVFIYTKPYLDENINKIKELTNNFDITNVNDVVNGSYSASLEAFFDLKKVFNVMNVENQEIKIDEDVYEIRRILSDAINYAVTSKTNDKVELSYNIDQDIPVSLIGDVDKVFQIILSSLYYSIENTSVGKINLLVGCTRNDGIVNLKIIISDTGNGVKEEEYNKIISELNDLDNHLDTIDKNLIFIKKYVEYLNGTFSFTSNYMVGNNITINISQKISNSTHLGIFELNNSYEVFDLSNRKVLIVDDVNSNSINYLKPYKINYELYNSIEEVINVLKGDKTYDLIIINVLHDLSEMYPAKTLKSVGTSMEIKLPLIVALTSNNIVGTKKKLINEGFDDVLLKPIDEYDLNKILEKIK